MMRTVYITLHTKNKKGQIMWGRNEEMYKLHTAKTLLEIRVLAKALKDEALPDYPRGLWITVEEH